MCKSREVENFQIISPQILRNQEIWVDMICTKTTCVTLTFDHVTWKSFRNRHSLYMNQGRQLPAKESRDIANKFSQRLAVLPWPLTTWPQNHKGSSTSLYQVWQFSSEGVKRYWEDISFTKTSSLTLNFFHGTWKSIGAIKTRRATTVPSLATSSKGVKKCLDVHCLLFLKRLKDLYIAYSNYTCLKKDFAKGISKLKRTKLGAFN